MIEVAPYSQLASAYDRALGIVSFVRARRAFEHLVSSYDIRFRSAADIGCGTGLFACYLRRCWGVPVYAVDASRAMLGIAARRCCEPGVRVLNQDVRCLNLPRPVDLITANFDTVNHLLTPVDLGRAFQRIAANLRIGGHFVFDVIPRYCGPQMRFTYVRRLRATGRALFQHIRWEPRRGLLAIRIVHCWPRPRPPTIEFHMERAYPPPQVARLLLDAGFVIRGVHDACSLRVATARPARLVIVARKRFVPADERPRSEDPPMYLHSMSGGSVDEDPTIGSTDGLDMAVAVPVGVGISIGAALEAIAVVLAAIAAAYLLIRAYEAAHARGFGIVMAQNALSAGLGTLVSGARRLVEIIRRLIERARRLARPRPECAAAIVALEQALAGIERTVAELTAEARSALPRVPELNRLMAQLRQQASAIRGPLQAVLAACRTT